MGGFKNVGRETRIFVKIYVRQVSEAFEYMHRVAFAFGVGIFGINPVWGTLDIVGGWLCLIYFGSRSWISFLNLFQCFYGLLGGVFAPASFLLPVFGGMLSYQVKLKPNAFVSQQISFSYYKIKNSRKKEITTDELHK
jgi:hypothetical protein